MRYPLSHSLAALLLCSACLLSACAGHGPGRAVTPQDPGTGQESTGPPAVAPMLPAPSSLPKGPATVIDSDRFRWGLMYETTSPSNKVTPAIMGTWAAYDPCWVPPATAQLTDTAYAIYCFTNMTGYAGASRVKLGWDVPPAATGQVYVGLANFQRDCWTWSMLPPSNEIHPASLSPYTSPTGECYACVLVLGTEEVKVDWVLLGSNTLPQVSLITDLDQNPLQNIAPRTVQFDASASKAYGGYIVSFDFDWQGDGAWDLTGNTTGIASHDYTAGTYNFRVRVTDNEAQVATRSRQFVIINPANTPPNAVLTATPDSGNAPLAVVLDASGTTDDGTITRYQWDLDNDGNFELDGGAVPTLQHTFAMYGSQMVNVLVTDNDLATDTAFKTLVLQTGWRSWTVVSGVEVDEPMTSCVSGSGAAARVCLAYRDSVAETLKFVRATAADGSAWGPVITPHYTNWDLGYGLSMRPNSINLVPMIAYGAYDEGTHHYRLLFTWATDAQGTAWSQQAFVSGPEHSGSDNALWWISGRPSIASVGEGGSYDSRILFYRANDASGTTWGAPVEVVPPAASRMVKAISLISAGGFAVIGYSRTGPDPPDYSLGVISAADTTGATWNAPMLFGGIVSYCTGLTIAGGNPALCSGAHSQSGRLYYRRADDATGGVWSGTPAELAGEGFGGDCAMYTVGGVPAIAYSSFTNQDLWYIAAADAAGSSWLEPVQVRTAGYVGTYVTLTAISNKPVICYYDETNQLINAAWYEN